MHYKKLIDAHRAFYGGWEYRATDYDDYVDSKNWEEWSLCSVSVDEIEKLFSFIRKWDCYFQGDFIVFKKIYEEIYPMIKELEHERIEDIDPKILSVTEDLERKIRDVFDEVADCPGTGRYESTDASKILHAILPDFFVMWDDEIKESMVQGMRMGATYAFHFLPKVKEELEEAIRTCIDERKLNRTNAIRYIQEECNGKTLAKLADEYNYMKYTKGYPPLW